MPCIMVTTHLLHVFILVFTIPARTVKKIATLDGSCPCLLSRELRGKNGPLRLTEFSQLASTDKTRSV